ncbi:hypothetical protein BH09PLA1_BH09PLA1_24450 [soil metagenome]
MRIAIFVSGLVLLSLVTSARGQQLREPRDFPVDPVAYIGGNEVAGKDELVIERGGYRYKFVDANNKAMFEKEPERYEIQLGGACARMGPLNPGGPTDLYALHDGKIYIFASENCRQAFLTNAEAFLESDDPPPDVSDESIRRGRELLDQAVNAMGGAEKIDAIKTYDDKMYMVAGNDNAYNGLWISFPNSFCQKSKREERWWLMAAAADTAWFDTNERFHPMASVQQRAFQREMSRLLLVIVKSRAQPTFVCSWTGPGEIENQAVEQVAVALNGATSTLMIDPKTGKILGETYRARGPNGFLGEAQFAYSDFQSFDGITLPITWKARFNGEYIAEHSGTLDEVHVNAQFDDKMFQMPKEK